jgi:hypothetical protein
LADYLVFSLGIILVPENEDQALALQNLKAVYGGVNRRNELLFPGNLGLRVVIFLH